MRMTSSHPGEISPQPAILVKIFWNFTMLQYRSDQPQVKRNMISSIANLVCTRVAERLKTQEIRKYQENVKFGWRHSPAPSLPPRNYTLAIAVKNHAKVDIKLSLSCPVLLDFSIPFQILCPGLQVTSYSGGMVFADVNSFFRINNLVQTQCVFIIIT